MPSSQRSSGFHISDILNLENSELKHNVVHSAAGHTASTNDVVSPHHTNDQQHSEHLNSTSALNGGDTTTHLAAATQNHHHHHHTTTLLDHNNAGNSSSSASVAASAQAQAAAQFIANHNAAAAVAAAGQYLPKNFANGFNDDMSSYHIAHTMLTHSGRSPWIKENELYGKFQRGKFYKLKLKFKCL